MVREKIHRKYIQIIGHHKRKVIGVLILGILGMGFIIFYFWNLKVQYKVSPIVPSSDTQVDINFQNQVDMVQEGFVKGQSIN